MVRTFMRWAIVGSFVMLHLVSGAIIGQGVIECERGNILCGVMLFDLGALLFVMLHMGKAGFRRAHDRHVIRERVR